MLETIKLIISIPKKQLMILIY